jgi:hypothetical protein
MMNQINAGIGLGLFGVRCHLDASLVSFCERRVQEPLNLLGELW